MSIDFFKAQCQTKTFEIKFGICDDDDELPAYIDNKDENSWIATVLNENAKNILFTAIDKCIDFPLVDGEMPIRCDVMLTCDNCLYIVELKNKRADWQSSGTEQLESTAKYLMNE